MTKGDLDGVQIWGRPLKPVALGLSVLMFTLTVLNIIDQGVFKDLMLGDIVAVLSGTSFILLMAGWFGKSQVLAELGLLTACIVYVVRGSFILFTAPHDQGLFLSLGAAIIAGGAYLLEMWDHKHWGKSA